MLLFRCLQGIGAALVLSCGAALVIPLHGEERRGQALGIYTMMLAVGLMLGPLLGGALSSAWGWPAVFWFRVPIALAALLLFRSVRAPSKPQAGDRFDIPGAVALVLGLVTMLFALNRMREFSAVWFALLSALAFAAFIFRERRAARPIIAVNILWQPGLALLDLEMRGARSGSLFSLAANIICPGPRAGLQPDRKRRHPGDGCGRGRAISADRRSACGGTDFGPAPRDRRRRDHRHRPAADRRVPLRLGERDEQHDQREPVDGVRRVAAPARRPGHNRRAHERRRERVGREATHVLVADVHGEPEGHEREGDEEDRLREGHGLRACPNWRCSRPRGGSRA